MTPCRIILAQHHSNSPRRPALQTADLQQICCLCRRLRLLQQRPQDSQPALPQADGHLQRRPSM